MSELAAPVKRKHRRKGTILTGRKRGAQPGNTNAFRHGFYSDSYSLADLQALDSNVKGEFRDEINLARVNANRLAEVLQDYKNMSIEDFIAASNALSNFLERIRGLPAPSPDS